MKLSKLDDMLDKKLGSNWHEWELETISLEIGILLDDLTVLKIVMLKTLQSHPEMILNDADYFLRFVEVANNNISDPHHADMPTSLELDFALKELEHILGKEMHETNMIRNVVKYTINQEGHGVCASNTLAKYGNQPLVKTEYSHAYEMYANEMLNKVGS